MKKYINFDKIEKQVYLKYFLEDYKINLKIHLEDVNDQHEFMKIDGFKLDHNIYLTEF
ncbi:MAG: hypothetical protein JW891_03610 [Candidatus Lokiarchaeota archaeon]|nr:hypothetical protein [Candidatus Lokiarchaeota archaeon]